MEQGVLHLSLIRVEFIFTGHNCYLTHFNASFYWQVRHDFEGVPGWEAVDELAAFLVGLNRTITALSVGESDEVLRLYERLYEADKTPPKYPRMNKQKRQPTVLAGMWRASRKRSKSAQGQQAAER